MRKPKIGLLPLYLALYDRLLPDCRARMEAFYSTIASELGERGMEVATCPVCRVESEFASAIQGFEQAGVDAIVTLHLAYSPSLESVRALAKTPLPVIVLDTTPTYSYGPDQDPAELMYNHGIHGVQDLCNMLIREGKEFQIEAGHWERSDVIERAASWARAARCATGMRNARVGLLGTPFVGMGDFSVPEEVLRDTIGMQVAKLDFAKLRALIDAVGEDEVEAEIESDLSTFEPGGIDRGSHEAAARTGMAIRRWMESEGLSAFTMNFDSFDEASGIPTVPFLEASKAMARGQGYAGEGDVLTAALVGALASVFPETTFTEMFCPDWENDAIYLSHMGELNPKLTDGRALLFTKTIPFIAGGMATMAVGRFRGGRAALVDLAPGPDDTYTLIIAPVTMLDFDADNMGDSVRGWFRPEMPVPRFLEDYSRLGGTHHAALVYGEVADRIAQFAMLMGWETVILEDDSDWNGH